MLAFSIRRLIEAVLVMVTVALIAFTLFRFVGDPVNQMVGQDTSLEDRLRLREELGLNDPIPVQFARFLTSAAQFDFGISYQMKQPVTAIIRDRFPATLELALTAALFAVALGIPMGVYTGIHRDSWLSKIFLTVSLIGVSLPTFLIGILLIYVFAVWLGVLPSFGRGRWCIGFWARVCPDLRLGPDPAGGDAGPVPDDAGDAAGALGDPELRTDYIKSLAPRAGLGGRPSGMR
jgi:peptide/nickel transport system permease protein